MPPVFSTILDDTVTYAKWKPSGNGMPGIMSCGKITVETLETAKRDLRIFLTNNRKLAPSDYVERCLNVWEDPRISNWIEQNRDEFTKLDFNKFFTVLRDRVLEHDWQDSTFRKMRAVRMPEGLNTSISDLAVQLLVLNNLLQGTPRFQSEENLKIMLIDAMDAGLRESYNKEIEDHAANLSHGIHSKDFDAFTKAMQVLDNSRHRQLLMARQMAEHMIKSRPNSRSTTPLTSSSAANSQNKRTGSMGGSSNLSGRLPPLTTNERRLLGDNEGCFKCRSFFVKCRTSSAEHEFPLPVGTGYKELTTADVEAARKLRGPPADSNKRARTGPIATVGTLNETEDDDVVASIMPSAVLGDGTDSEEEI
ncbi:reverse transcriptase-RNase H-integrase [Lentinula edodes]|uniref:Reverse transcriptase-RNase H-integrase n=1 Tax=Lentinula edodes TaxID=5353 RepID=A0A1Q3EFG3_LENED|nr:reverse transcriptase-RNase H-integrase [Lentinula edodes]